MNTLQISPVKISERHEHPTTNIGAVVVGGDYQGLGIVRSLGRRGVPACVIDDENSIARFSRYTTHSLRVDSLREERKCLETLLEIGRRLRLYGWVLFPTREETVAALSRYRSELAEVFRVPTPAWDSVGQAWDKRNTYGTAAELGIPVPRTWYARNLTELSAIDFDPPYAIKPAIKEHFFYATKAKAWRANSREELAALFQRASAQTGSSDEVIVQELIPGGGSQQFAYCAFFKNGSAHGSLVAQRLRQHPHEFGRASTYVQTIELPELEEMSTRFLRAIGYYGLVELEYKLDSRSGQYKLLDVNARTWGYHTIGQAAGVDFPYLLFADQLGIETDSCRARAGARWMRFSTDFPAAALEVVAGRLSLADYWRTVRDFDVEAVFCRDDPRPGLAELALIPYLAVKRGF